MIESNIDLESRAKAASKSTWVSVVVNIFLSIGQILIGKLINQTNHAKRYV